MVNICNYIPNDVLLFFGFIGGMSLSLLAYMINHNDYDHNSDIIYIALFVCFFFFS